MPSNKRKNESESDNEGETKELVDVDFEFFGPTEIDYLALKRLLNQLFSTDANLFQIEKLTELILEQPGIGSTVKTDGIDSDPYAILTVLNMNVHKDHPSIKAIISYLLEKVPKDSSTGTVLGNIFSPQALAASSGHTGLIISERLINMPPQIMPPMYRMLGEELVNAASQNEPFSFDNYVLVSRCFRFDDNEESATGTSQPVKKQKRKGGILRSYHAEDEHIEKSSKIASAKAEYEYTSRIEREQDSFGVDVAGRVMVFPQSKFAALVSLVDAGFPAGTS
ncbi:p21-carboxy-terminal region-binding protein [Rhizoctonia solani 123E]|uniref:Protein BCP1 n=1 Tax=Rhizoctonia solani 123E TaxID=1423351 RepID=A0A074S1N6_9AGAM|nr:p21-carboxy-terminal region-binding protein [Rhizoctonia solani 123E]